MRTFLGFVFALFIGILVFVWWGAAQADPVVLDERGAVRGSQ